MCRLETLEQNERWFLNRALCDALLPLPIVLIPLVECTKVQEIVPLCSGLLLPGGNDALPCYYGEQTDGFSQYYDAPMDLWELTVLDAFVKAKKPVLGICRGIQVMNVVLGGTLYQDIKPFAHVPHNDHWAKIHTVTVRRGTKLEQIMGQDTVLVNSQHHQAVDRIAPGLTLAALSEDGIVEAIEKPDAKFCLGVQWHPEWLSAADPAMQGLFDAFVAACRH